MSPDRKLTLLSIIAFIYILSVNVSIDEENLKNLAQQTQEKAYQGLETLQKYGEEISENESVKKLTANLPNIPISDWVPENFRPRVAGSEPDIPKTPEFHEAVPVRALESDQIQQEQTNLDLATVTEAEISTFEEEDYADSIREVQLAGQVSPVQELTDHQFVPVQELEPQLTEANSVEAPPVTVAQGVPLMTPVDFNPDDQNDPYSHPGAVGYQTSNFHAIPYAERTEQNWAVVGPDFSKNGDSHSPFSSTLQGSPISITFQTSSRTKDCKKRWKNF